MYVYIDDNEEGQTLTCPTRSASVITRCSVSSSPFSNAPAIIDAITSGETDSTSPLVSTKCLLLVAAADAARKAVCCAL